MLKSCSLCKEQKNINQFYQSTPTRLHSWCKTCHSTEKKRREKIPGSRAQVNYKIGRLRISAKRFGRDVTISKDKMRELITQTNCYYCGLPMSEVCIDRVDNSGHYSDSNCVACCRPCNSQKASISVEFARKIVEFAERAKTP